MITVISFVLKGLRKQIFGIAGISMAYIRAHAINNLKGMCVLQNSCEVNIALLVLLA